MSNIGNTNIPLHESLESAPPRPCFWAVAKTQTAHSFQAPSSFLGYMGFVRMANHSQDEPISCYLRLLEVSWLIRLGVVNIYKTRYHCVYTI